jgi:hypothetical protein
MERLLLYHAVVVGAPKKSRYLAAHIAMMALMVYDGSASKGTYAAPPTDFSSCPLGRSLP